MSNHLSDNLTTATIGLCASSQEYKYLLSVQKSVSVCAEWAAAANLPVTICLFDDPVVISEDHRLHGRQEALRSFPLEVKVNQQFLIF